MNSRQLINGCLSKIRYSTEAAAQFFAQADSLDYYECENCGGFHLTAKAARLAEGAGIIPIDESSIWKGEASIDGSSKRPKTAKQRRKFVLLRRQWRASQRKRSEPIIGS